MKIGGEAVIIVIIIIAAFFLAGGTFTGFDEINFATPAPGQGGSPGNPGTRGIIDVDLTYSTQNAQFVSIDKVQAKDSSITPNLVDETYPYKSDNFQLEITDTSGGILATKKFHFSNTVINEEKLFNKNYTGTSKITESSIKTTITLPSFANGSKIVLRKIDGTLIGSTNYTPLAPIRSQSSGSVASSGLNFAIVASGYSSGQLPTFQNDAQKFISGIRNTQPYTGAPINYNIFPNTADLKCVHPNPQIQRLITCDQQLVIKALDDHQIAHDAVLVIVNENTYGGSGTFNGLAVIASGTDPANVAAHELGHSFGGLWDEYSYSQDQGHPALGTIDNQTHANCYGGNPPAADWTGIVPTGDYYKECANDNYYRASQTSIMRDVGTPYFNEISSRILRTKMGLYSGNPTTSPTATTRPSSSPTTRPTSTPTATFTPTATPTRIPTYSTPGGGFGVGAVCAIQNDCLATNGSPGPGSCVVDFCSNHYNHCCPNGMQFCPTSGQCISYTTLPINCTCPTP